jgi:hypothetical protein
LDPGSFVARYGCRAESENFQAKVIHRRQAGVAPIAMESTNFKINLVDPAKHQTKYGEFL